MEATRRPTDDLLDVVGVLLLLQGSIFVATTIEALIWGAVFAGAAGVPAFMSGAGAAVILVARVRLSADRWWTRRLVYIVEVVTLATLAIDTAFAIALTGQLPPAVALLTRLVLPMSLIVLLRRAARATTASISSSSAAALEGAS